ncbi:MAG: bifunctional 2-polyprenyl-6-hydroxyphenol methylase/3-demethylubiquinol 3-O-methyltransferase UbiG [Pseudomonadales bacterium]|nr:bifunctional 2-polyprenyl-6-hydroxyphenol methylase/3-demethylubiquinol 3-O-methyltransferase UbiG [Pseudomonadales bacterium]
MSDNIDPEEIQKFEDMARRWWDPSSEFKPLHAINPLRMGYIADRAAIAGKRALDIGCGGGLLTEALAAAGAETTGIDMGAIPLQVAKLHRHESGLEIDYQMSTAEQFAHTHAGEFDVVTCLEMLEHVPDPGSVIRACARLLKPGGDLFVSTINRNPKSYAFAIVGAEYVLGLLPRGTHDYQKFIRPSELAQSFRDHRFSLQDLTGMTYNPLTGIYRLSRDTDVNYLMHAKYEPELS